MAFVELKIDPKYHRHIIGRSGANGISCFLSHVHCRWFKTALLPSFGLIQWRFAANQWMLLQSLFVSKIVRMSCKTVPGTV